MLALLPFAGCTINDPLLDLAHRGLAQDIFRAGGFSESPHALSPGGILQLLSLLHGADGVPQEIWRYCYAGTRHIPDAAQRETMANADAILIEVSTLTEYRLGSVILHANAVNEDLGEKLSAVAGMDQKAVRAWRSALSKCKDDLRSEAAAAILVHYPADTPAQRVDREVIAGVRTAPCESGAVEHCVRTVRDAFDGVPIGLSLHHFQYMSGGRAIDWPPELNNEVRGVARRLEVPLYDSAHLVATHGNEKALTADNRGWAPGFFATAGEDLFGFVGTFFDKHDNVVSS